MSHHLKKRYGHSTAGKEYVYIVRSFDHASGRWQLAGTVKLAHGADGYALEEALSRRGIYAPRGADTFSWGSKGCQIATSDGTPIAKLTRRDS